jgi:hypothetical protein
MLWNPGRYVLTETCRFPSGFVAAREKYITRQAGRNRYLSAGF